jgi:tetratricopeptide (TPR) repeat protein
VKVRLDAALGRADALAQKRLAANPDDEDALFALALASGLKADYLSLIEARNLAALSPTKRANEWAQKLLRKDPDYADAYLATGLSKYIIGSTPAPIRWVLAIGGYSGDKKEGIRELELTAEKGRLLAPFARLLLTMAYLRQGNTARARQMLESLQEEFPENPLYAREIARIAAGRG